MQGKKKYTPKIFYKLSLDALVPEDNFYRKLQAELSLDFLYKATRSYYGKEGQSSIDPLELRSQSSQLLRLVAATRLSSSLTCWVSQQH